MPKIKTVYQSKENIYAKFHRSGEWVEYSVKITIKETGKFPVVLKMKLESEPSFFELPETHLIKAENITTAYEKVSRYFRKYGLEFR